MADPRIEAALTEMRRLREILVVTLIVEQGADAATTQAAALDYTEQLAEQLISGNTCEQCGGPEMEVIRIDGPNGPEVSLKLACTH